VANVRAWRTASFFNQEIFGILGGSPKDPHFTFIEVARHQTKTKPTMRAFVNATV